MFFFFWTGAKPGFHSSWQSISFTSSGVSGDGTKTGLSAIRDVPNQVERDVLGDENFAFFSLIQAALHCRVSPVGARKEHLEVNELACFLDGVSLDSRFVRHVICEQHSIVV